MTGSAGDVQMKITFTELNFCFRPIAIVHDEISHEASMVFKAAWLWVELCSFFEFHSSMGPSILNSIPLVGN